MVSGFEAGTLMLLRDGVIEQLRIYQFGEGAEFEPVPVVSETSQKVFGDVTNIWIPNATEEDRNVIKEQERSTLEMFRSDRADLKGTIFSHIMDMWEKFWVAENDESTTKLAVQQEHFEGGEDGRTVIVLTRA
ncbi:MAG: hypothetical protein Q9221_007014 [Calogaya cf. arnoldii]